MNSGPARWTHRPTWPDHRPADDREILRGGEVVARTYSYEHGPQAGRWGWFGRWDGPGNAGLADSLEAAREAVRASVTARDP